MNSVRLYYIKYQGESDPAQIDELLMDQWLSELSSQKRQSVQRLLNHSDRMTSLFALRLLKMCAQDESIDNFKLCDVQYPDKGKPVWKNNNCFFDFNISHSNGLILIAVSKTVKVGVDVEKIRELKRLSFKMVMLPEEITRIKETPCLFFDLWSKKEAVVKAADTAGVSRMRDIKLNEDEAILDEKKWCLKNVSLNDQLDPQYAIYLATSEPVAELIIKGVSIDEL
jgi:4'-phosphopantetheinyl transferase